MVESTHDIFTLFSPFNRIKTLLLISGYKITAKSRVVAKSSLNQAISLSIHFSVTIGFIYLFSTQSASLNNSSKLIYLAIQGFKYTDMALMLWSAVLPKLKNNTYVVVLNKMSDVESNLNRLGVNLDHRRIKKTINFTLGVYLAMMIIHVGILNYAEIGSNLTIFNIFLSNVVIVCSYATPVIVLLDLYCVLFVLSTLLGVVRFKLLKLQNKFDKNDLNVLAKIYEDIYFCKNRFSPLCSIIFLLNFIRNFCLITIQLFSTVVMAFHSPNHYVTMSILISMIIVYFYNIFLCNLVCNECNRQTEMLQKSVYWMFSVMKNEEIRRQLHSFALLIAHCPINIEPLGLFKINFQFLFAVIATVHSYIILLFQFDSNADIYTIITTNRSEINQ